MRKRKKADDISVRVYRFRCYPTETPQHLWDVAKSMRHLWNRLVIARNRYSKILSKKEKTLAKQAWKERFEPLTKDFVEQSKLNWECGPTVLDRFNSACVAAAKNIRDWPKLHGGLRKIMIPHRYTGGGSPLSALFSPRSSRLRIEDLNEHAYKTNVRRARYLRCVDFTFGLDDVDIKGRVVMHRLIPANAIVKACALTGERTGKDWNWHLTVTVEEKVPTRVMTGKACGIDMGWRHFAAEGRVRFGMIADSMGAVREMTLPTSFNNANSRRHPHMKLSGWVDLYSHWDPIVSNLRTEAMKTGNWDEYRRNASIRRELHRRCVEHRDKIYERIAAFLTETYDEIAIEALSVKVMAEAKEKAFAIKAADKYRQMTAPATFLLKLKSAATFRGCKIIECDPAYSTLTCSKCGSVLRDQDGAVIQKCPQGCLWDQDVNAAKNLLTRTSPDARWWTDVKHGIPADIKENLADYTADLVQTV